MVAIGLISSAFLLGGSLLILASGVGRAAPNRTALFAALLAFAGYVLLVTLFGEMSRTVAVASFIVGMSGLLVGLWLWRNELRRPADAPSRSPLHIDPVIDRIGRATNAVLWDWEVAGNMVNFSSNIITMLGYDRKSLRTKLDWWAERVHPDDRERAVETLMQAVRAVADSWEAEYRFERGDGSYAHIIDRGFVIADAKGKAIRMVGAMEDITGQRIAEQTAREREVRYETLADNASDLIARLDRDLRHIYVNRAVVEVTGIPEQQFLGRTNREIGMPEKLCDQWDAALEGVFKTGEPSTLEFAYNATTGARYLMARITPEYRPDGAVESVLSIVRDITELREASDHLQREKSFIDTAINSLPGIFYLVNTQGRFIRWNENFERVTGYSAKEIASMQPTEFFHGTDKEYIRQRIEEVFEHGQSWAEADLVARDGTRTPFYFTGQRVVLDGEPCLVGMGIDVSRRREVEQRLRDSEERYRLLFESNPHPMWVFDVETLRFLAVNNAAIRKYGYSRDEFLSLTIADIRPQEDVPRLMEAVRRPAATEGVDDAGIWRHRLKDGTLIDVEIVSHGIEFGGRKAELVLANDVTERLKAERELRSSEERFANFMDRNPAGAWIKDENGRYVYVNRTLCEEYRIDPDGIVGLTDFDLLRADVAKELAANDRIALESDHAIETIETINNPDGTDHTWLVVKFAMRSPEAPEGRAGPSQGRLVGGFALDITEKKRAEDALREYAEQLERSNRELEQFAYVASHDLQEPLRMVASYTQLLGERYKGRLDDDADEFIHYAVDGAKRMQRLIDDLLLYSRVGTQGNEPTAVNVADVLNDALENLRALIHESGATIERCELPTVLADRRQLVQVFQNLLANAIKFRSDQPPRIAVRAERHEEEWLFAVSDNGIGIDPAYNERIFVIFQRLHGRAEYAGTGIGLALCKRIVERHGGRIWVESVPGDGATFFFTLPIGKENLA